MASKVATIVALVGTIKLNVGVCIINEFTISKLNFSRCWERERERGKYKLISRLFITFPWCALGHSLPLTHNIVLTIVMYTHVHNHHCVNHLWREARADVLSITYSSCHCNLETNAMWYSWKSHRLLASMNCDSGQTMEAKKKKKAHHFTNLLKNICW